MERQAPVPRSEQQKAVQKAESKAKRRAAHKAARKNPKHPLAYFVKIEIGMALLMLLAVVLLTVLIYLTASGSVAREPFATLLDLSGLVPVLAFGVCLSAYLQRKTVLGRKVADFQWMYYCVPLAAVQWLSRLFSARASSSATWQVVHILACVLAVAAFFVYLAFFLCAAVETDAQKRRKALNILFCIALAGYCFSLLLTALRGGFANASTYALVQAAVQAVCFFALLFGGFFGMYRLPKLKVLWLYILPILYCVLPSVFSVAKKWIAA